jgi:circadian clock protein KaiC
LLPGLHAFRINDAGIQMFAPPPLSALVEKWSTRSSVSRLLTGVPRLDNMLGGGLPCGYSLLVAGPFGSGKSI